MYDYYDSFDCEIGCEEYYGEEYNLWEEEQCFLDGYWESLTEVGE